MAQTWILVLCCLFTSLDYVFGDDALEYQIRLNKFYDSLESDPQLWSELENSFVPYDDDLIIPPFECEVLPEYEPATNVHELKPSDISVVASLGDSITAGNGCGAETLPGVAIENRGYSWAIGGNETIESSLTFPNLVKKYNPNLKGWSWSREVITDRNDTHCGNPMYCSQLNVAEPGATNRGMAGQAETLVEKLKDNNRTEGDIDFDNDWKVITIFVGGNDLCRICENFDSYGPEAYRDGVQEALDILHDNVPRALVNLVLYFDVTPLENISTGIICDALQWGFCACARREDTLPLMKGYQMEYAYLLEELVDSGRYDTRDDFTVVIQPHNRDLGPVLDENGDVDHSYFAPDCFHLSQKSHQGEAYMLWNVMLMPVGQKPYEYDAYEEPVFRCPSQEHPYIFTNLNSDVDWNPEASLKLGREKIKRTMKQSESEGIEFTRIYNEALDKIYQRASSDVSIQQELETSPKDDDDYEIPPFECEVLPHYEPAMNVHELKPSDIKVVAALGDSITAGNGVGAETLAGVAINNRGYSWCIGGNETIETMISVPNLIKMYNPNVTGWSWSREVITDRNDTHCGNPMYCSQLNVAVPGATNLGMAGQAETLIEKLKDNNSTEGDIDYENDWKLITLFIGGNDLCRVCMVEEYEPESYRDGVQEALDILHEHVPRALVNLVLYFDVSPLSNISDGLICDLIHPGLCPCAIDEETQPLLKDIQMEYSRLLEELVESGRYDTRDDFTVVLQPHHRDLEPIVDENGDIDHSFFAPDCFHLSKKGHHGLAYMLWNVMLMPVGQKPYMYDAYEDYVFRCPSEEHPYIFTNLNSDVDWSPEASLKLGRKKIKKTMKPSESEGIEFTRIYNEALDKIYQRASSDVSIQQELEASPKDDDDYEIPPFECEVLPHYEPAANVHELKPSDIKVVAALGDSITAGNGVGAETVAGVAINNRGYSWCIGGNETIETMISVPNLIKMYNPNVTGWSWSREVITDRNDTHCGNPMYCSQLNVAVPGATNVGMAGQAETLIEKLKDNNSTEGDIDYENDWKLITLFIGGNDLCRVCMVEAFEPESYRDGVQEALDILHEHVPRALVNLVLYFDVSPLSNISDGLICDLIHPGLCPCAIDEETQPLLKDIQMEYSRLLEELVESGRYDTRGDFTVVLQPHHRDLEPIVDENGDIDHSFFAPDCFHLSKKGHHGLAYMLWNVMLMPVGQKPYMYDAYEDYVFRCPSEEHPYIFTNLNSDVDWSPEESLLQGRRKSGSVKKKSGVYAMKHHAPLHTMLAELSGPDEYKKKQQRFNDWLEAEPSRMEAWLKKWEEYTDDGIEIPPFSCNTDVPDFEPQSVHELRPTDIQVIAAFGDSITSGNGVGAATLPGVYIENRGESWCIGGNQSIDTVLTIPNILREFNPDLQGWSYSRTPGVAEDRNKTHCTEGMTCAQLNVAVPGATNRDMPEQADDMIQKTLEHPNIDMENDWKIVFMLIGGNDLCAVCRRWDDYNPDNYVANIEIALNKLKEAMPRTMVHVVTMFDITPLSNYSTGPLCNIAHMSMCDCAVYNDSVNNMMRPIQMEYWDRLDELINVNGTYDGDDGFTVVLQPHMRDLVHPVTEDGEWDSSYLAPDCFHPGRKSHQTMAYTTWNMLLTPVDEKPYTYPEEELLEFKCPTEETPYIFTNDNSRVYRKLHKEVKIKPVDWVEAAETDRREYERRMEKFLEKFENDEELAAAYKQRLTEPRDMVDPIPPFECTVGEYEPAVSVHALRPSDIRVVASFGDSITAGNGVGADRALGVAVENRGESWSIGGNQSIETILTIPNLIKKFNPAVTGWSWSRDSRVLERNETYCSENMVCSQLNVAEPGATNRGMANQAQDIIDRLKDTNFTSGDIDYDNDWKLITLFIGGNDLCRVCDNWDSYSPEAYLEGIQEALDRLHAEVPRALVNLVVMFDISPLTNVSDGLICRAVQLGFCSCAVIEESRQELRGIQLEYARLLEELVESGRYDTRDDFTVVLHPHMRDFIWPLDEDGNIDGSYLSEDCFHPSRRGHHTLALMLWNVMLIPVGHKGYTYDHTELEREFSCPSEEYPYIFTNMNSDVTWPPETTNHKDASVHKPKARKYVPHPAKATLVQSGSVDDATAKGQGSSAAILAIVAVATVGIVVIILAVVVVFPYWKNTRKGRKGYSDISTQYENPTFVDAELST